MSTPTTPWWIDTGATSTDGAWIDINNHTQVVGLNFLNYGSQAFRWTHDGSENGDLEIFGGSQAYGINDPGQFVGWAYVDTKGGYRAFRYTDGEGMKNLGALGNRSVAYGINSLGQVVGYYDVVTTAKGLATLQHRYGFLHTDASGMVNLDNLVIGSAEDLAKWASAVQIEPRKINTPRLVDGTVVSNGFGQICGTAWFKDSTGQATISDSFLLTPEPK